jgi:hypothetical protein
LADYEKIQKNKAQNWVLSSYFNRGNIKLLLKKEVLQKNGNF